VTENQTKLPSRNLDVLRAVAVIAVIVAHVGNVAQDTMYTSGLYGPLGHAGVMLFFVHTACVLMGSLDRGGRASGWVRRFYIRRAFRIYPLAIATVLIVAIFRIPPRPESGSVFVWGGRLWLALNMILAQNLADATDALAVLWSLPIEVDMYVVLPLAFSLVAAHRSWVRALAAFVLALTLATAAAILGLTGPVGVLVRMTPCFMAGVLVYTLRGERWLRLRSLHGAAVALVAGIVYCVLPVNRAWPVSPVDWGFTAVIGILLIGTAETRESIMTRAAAVVAKYSYGIYLLHLVAFWFAFRVIGGVLPTTLVWLVAGAGTILLPWLGYHLVEAPGIVLGQVLTNKKAARFPSLSSTAPPP
jgi:peptidoglycan/LPS O-acetylase OafA/YrhL